MENPWKVIAAFLGVFVAGAIFGGVFSIGVGAQWMSHQAQTVAPTTSAQPPATKPPAHPANGQRPLLGMPMNWQAGQLLRRYAERLGLTSEQKQRIIPLLQRASEDYRRVQQNSFRETAIILQRLHQDIISELNPDQRDKLIDWEKNQRAIIQRMEQRQRELRRDRKALEELGKEEPPTKSAPATKESTAPTTSTAPTSSGTTSSAPTPAASSGGEPASTATSGSPSATNSEKQQ